MANVTINTTSNSATVHIYNMDTDHYTKQIVFYLNGSYYDSVGLDNGYDCPDGTYDFTYRNLSPNTNYTFSIEISMLLFPSGANPYYPQDSLSGYFTTDSDGGGGGGEDDNPSFTAEVYGDNNIYVKISNLIRYDRIYFYLWLQSDHSNPIDQSSAWGTTQYDFYNLSAGYYDVSVKYWYNGQQYYVYTPNEWEYYPIQITGGGSVIPTFSASVVNNNQIQIFVQNRQSDQYLRYFVRLESDETDHTYDTWRDIGYLVQDDTITITNLLYNTWYRINVGYSNEPNSGVVDWIIKPTDNPYLLQTNSQPISGSYVYIYTGSGANQGWKKAVPYIYTGSGANQGWKQAQAYIFNGSAWKKTTE